MNHSMLDLILIFNRGHATVQEALSIRLSVGLSVKLELT